MAYQERQTMVLSKQEIIAWILSAIQSQVGQVMYTVSEISDEIETVWDGHVHIYRVAKAKPPDLNFTNSQSRWVTPLQS